MQIEITASEKRELKKLTAPHGATSRFMENAGISWNALNKLRTIGRADEEIVERVRAYLAKISAGVQTMKAA